MKLNKALKILLFTNALILLSSAMLGPIYALSVNTIGGSLFDASMAGGVFALAAGLTTLVSGKFSDRVKESELIVVLGYIIMGMGFLLYLWVNSVFLIFIIQAVIGLGEAIYLPAFDSVYSKHMNRRKSGTQWSAWESMNYFIAAFGAMAGGILVTIFSFKLLFVVMALLCFISSIYIYHLNRKVL